MTVCDTLILPQPNLGAVVLDRTMRDDDELVLDDDFDDRGHSARNCRAASERSM